MAERRLGGQEDMYQMKGPVTVTGQKWMQTCVKCQNISLEAPLDLGANLPLLIVTQTPYYCVPSAKKRPRKVLFDVVIYKNSAVCTRLDASSAEFFGVQEHTNSYAQILNFIVHLTVLALFFFYASW